MTYFLNLYRAWSSALFNCIKWTLNNIWGKKYLKCLNPSPQIHSGAISIQFRDFSIFSIMFRWSGPPQYYSLFYKYRIMFNLLTSRGGHLINPKLNFLRRPFEITNRANCKLARSFNQLHSGSLFKIQLCATAE